MSSKTGLNLSVVLGGNFMYAICDSTCRRVVKKIMNNTISHSIKLIKLKPNALSTFTLLNLLYARTNFGTLFLSAVEIKLLKELCRLR